MAADRLQSEFNMAVSYLNRLNALFYEADDASMNLDAHRWFHALYILFRELSTEMKPSEIEAFTEMANNIHISVNENNYITDQNGFSSINSDLYKQLHDFEIKIRAVLKSAGLQNKMKEDPRFALR